jgi:hypothetical protein
MTWAPVHGPRSAVLPVFDPQWKDKCQQCKHLVVSKNEEMMCYPLMGLACIDAVSDAHLCGPDRKLFQPKKG